MSGFSFVILNRCNSFSILAPHCHRRGTEHVTFSFVPDANSWQSLAYTVSIVVNLDGVPFDVEADMLEAENSVHPGAATHALNPEAFAAQLLGSLEVRAGDHRVGKLARNRRKNFKIRSLRRRSQDRGATRISDINIAGQQARNQDRRAFDEHEPGLEAVFRENPLLLGENQGNDPWTYGRMRDGDFGLGPNWRNDEEGQPQKQCTNNNRHVRFHDFFSRQALFGHQVREGHEGGSDGSPRRRRGRRAESLK